MSPPKRDLNSFFAAPSGPKVNLFLDELDAELVKQISIARRELLGAVEAVYGDTSQWRYIRGQILRALGERGLEGRLRVFCLEAREDEQREESGAL